MYIILIILTANNSDKHYLFSLFMIPRFSFFFFGFLSILITIKEITNNIDCNLLDMPFTFVSVFIQFKRFYGTVHVIPFIKGTIINYYNETLILFLLFLFKWQSTKFYLIQKFGRNI